MLGTCFVEAADGHCYNQIRFYRADGEFLGFHSKTLQVGIRQGCSLVPTGRCRSDHQLVELKRAQWRSGILFDLASWGSVMEPQRKPSRPPFTA